MCVGVTKGVKQRGSSRAMIGQNDFLRDDNTEIPRHCGHGAIVASQL